MAAIKTFRDLLVWQKGMELVTQVYGVSREFPKEELYGLCSQMRRSAVSIPSNIAEGHGRKSTKEFIHFLNISTGSLYELETQFEIAKNLGYLKNPIIYNEVNGLCRELERMMTSLIRKLKDR